MKISLEWLNSYLDRPVTADQVQEVLTRAGFPIDVREDIHVGGVADVMLDVEVTSNRSDCLSHLGVAREVAASTGVKLNAPACDVAESDAQPGVDQLTQVQVQDPALCPVYTARVIRGVRVGPSPAWLVRRLEAVKLRSVNNVVDVTNYVLMEMGQPLHAFDMQRLGADGIVVRRAAEKEAFTAIDGSKHQLDANVLVIASGQKPVAVAGVMGGLESEVGSDTTDLLLESAVFNPLAVRKAARQLKLASDSSYRFERGVDPQGIERASARAARLIVELAGGQIAPGLIRVGVTPPPLKQVSMRVERCQALLGYDISPQRMIELLDSLGLSPVFDGQKIACTIPSFRLDLEREVDLIEEVARLQGLDEIPVHAKVSLVARSKQPEIAARSELNRVLVAHGYHETITFSFISPRLGAPFVPAGQQAVMVDDERRKAEPMLRPSLLPSLLACRKSNQDVGNANVKLYELAATWTRVDGKIAERRSLSLIHDAQDPASDLRELKGSLRELVERLAGGARLEFEPTEQAQFAAAARVVLDGRDVGVMGLFTQQVQQLFDLQTPVVGADLELEPLLAGYPPQRLVKRLPRYPGIERDLSVIVDETVAWDAIAASVKQVNPALLEDFWFLTTYRGKPIPAGSKSVSLRMLFRDPATTLRHEQVDPQVNAVLERLQQNVGAKLRS